MSHKYDKISKVITKVFGDNDEFEMIDHGNLVHFAYKVLETFEKDEDEFTAERSFG